MRRALVIFLAFAAWPSLAQAKDFAVVVLRHGEATTGQIGDVRSALGAGIVSTGGRLVDEVTVVELMRVANPATRECDASCEERMRTELGARTLVLGRLTTSTTHFALRVSNGSRSVSAAGPIVQLASAARDIGLRLTSDAPSAILLEGIPQGAEIFIDGTRVNPSRNGEVAVGVGRHIVRLGDGLGRYRMLRLDVPHGKTVTVRYDPMQSTPPTVSLRDRQLVAAPIPTATPRASATLRPKPLAVIGTAVVARSYALVAEDGRGVETSFLGVASVAEVETQRFGLVGRLNLTLITYDLSTTRFELESGDSASARGGTTHRARGTVGYAFGRGPIILTGKTGISFERHDAHVPHGPSGPLAVFASYSRLAWELEFGAAATTTLATFDLTIGGSPLSSWRESSRALGTKPRAAPAPSWSVGATRQVVGPWAARVEYAGEFRAVSRTGTSTIPTSPSLADVETQEMFHSLRASFHRAF